MKFRSFNFAVLFSFFALLTVYPYVFTFMLGLPSDKVMGIISLFLFVALIVTSKGKIRSIPPFIIVYSVFQSLIWVCFFLVHSDSTYLTRVFYVVLTLTALIALVKSKSLFSFVKYHNSFIAIQAVLGAIAFMLIFIGLLPPIRVFANTFGHDIYFYGLTCTNVVLDNVIRVAGFFDEPGALAAWGIYTLIFNKLSFDDKRIELSILICLLTTLSAAFFIQALLYLAFFYGPSVKVKNVKKIIVICLLMVGIIFVVLSSLGNNWVIARYTTERFQGGEIKSMRYELAEEAKQTFMSNPFFGIGAKKMDEGTYMGDNPYETLAKDGIIGTVVTYLPLLFLLYKYRRKDVLSAVIVLSAGYAQRPFHMNLIHCLFLYMLCLMCYYKYEKPMLLFNK